MNTRSVWHGIVVVLEGSADQRESLLWIQGDDESESGSETLPLLLFLSRIMVLGIDLNDAARFTIALN